jgi:hypothetical protein
MIQATHFRGGGLTNPLNFMKIWGFKFYFNNPQVILYYPLFPV